MPLIWSQLVGRLIITLGGVVALTACLLPLRDLFGPINLVLCYVPLLFLVAIRLGRSAGVVASIASFLSYNFFFVPPLYTLMIEAPQDVLELCVFLGVSLIAGTLAARERVLTQAALRRAEQMTGLYNLSQDVSASLDSATILPKIATAAVTVLRVTGVEITLSGNDGRSPSTACAGICAETSAQTVPIISGGRTVGELRAWGLPTPLVAGDEPSTLLMMIANQVALTAERSHAAAVALQTHSLREADRLKSALLSSVSHDLRTPLAVIKAAASNLLDSNMTWSSATQYAFAETIVAEADRLNRFVRNLLEMSRLEAGTTRREPTLIEINDLIASSLQRLGPLLTEHSIEVEIAPDLPSVAVDALQIELVFSNLLENAAKFAPCHTPIRLTAQRTGQELLLSIADRGPGIPTAALDHIFEKFYRVAAPEQGPGGTGLGLAICQGIVEAHSGRIWAENQPDGGAIFYLTLPLCPASVSRAIDVSFQGAYERSTDSDC